jgi:2,4-dienoyl-CoA reductase-like NADH-dependent reductase (Old Yellow Enzyme family)
MMTDTNCLFTPFTLGNLSLPNRIVMAPMTRNFSPDNTPNDMNIEYYRQRAAGGVGLIISEGTCIGHDAASGYQNVPYFYGEQALAGWKKVVDAVHAEGCKFAPQLWHVGGIRKPGSDGPIMDLPGYSPSGTAVPGKQTGHTMTQEDIDATVQAFIDAALSAQKIGCDAIEIHGAHGYLVDQFFWQGTNQRDDQYGGSMQNRSRFAIEIIKGIRAACGPDFPIILRWSQWKQQDYNAQLFTTPEAMAEFLLPLSEAGIDIFHCSTRRFWEAEFEGSELNLAGWTQKITGKPSIAVGSVGLNSDFLPEAGATTFKEGEPASLDNLIQRISNNEFDLVAVGRALIANPDWANKIKYNQTDQLKPYNTDALMKLV